MRIAVFTDSFLPGKGGTEQAVYNMCKALTEIEGNVVKVYCPQFHPKKNVDIAEFDVFRVPSFRLNASDMVALPSIFRQVYRDVEDFRPDVIHFCTVSGMAKAALKAGKRLGVPVVSTIHTDFEQAFMDAMPIKLVVYILMKQLAKRINTLLKSVDGIVITHGTDTMEETAYFLNLVIKSDKPVVLVGAMRPATAISADGPKNLYNAVALAGSKSAKGKGVMIAMDDTILGARDGVKTNTLQTSTFKALNSGPLGIIIDGKPFFYSSASRPHTINSEFDVSNLNTLPKVDILYTYSNDGSKVAAEAFLKAGAKGLVVAGSGAGSIHENQKNYLLDTAKNKQAVIVRSSRVGSGYVPDAKDGILNADNLNPQKARVLLMLALTKTSDPKQIQNMFNKY